MAVVVDTRFLVDVSRGDEAATALLDRLVDDGESLIVPAVVVAEFLAGSRAPAADLATIQAAGEVLPFTVEDAVAAGKVARDALARGEFPGWTDALIAGFARNRGDARVVTRNARHFPSDRVLTY